MMIDQAIIEFDKALRTVFAQARSVRPVPGDGIPESEMSDAERERMMDVVLPAREAARA